MPSLRFLVTLCVFPSDFDEFALLYSKVQRLKEQRSASVRDLATLTFARLVINMTRRFPYPFLPAISRQLGVPLDSVQNVMGVNAGVGAGSPLLGPLGERYGRKRVIMAMLIVVIGAALLGTLSTQFALFSIVMIIFGVAKMVFDPSTAAYIADHVPYERLGTAIGVTEMSWAGALLVIAPAAGFLLGISGLQSVFLLLAVGSGLALAAVYFQLPADHPHKDAVPQNISPRATWRALRSEPVAFRALAYSFLLVMANEIFFINYGAYLETTFKLSLTELGSVTVVIAVAEAVGEFAVATLADRIGKRRMAVIGAGVSGLAYVALPALSFSLPLTLALIFVIAFMIESTIVASIPLYAMILPDARAIMMSSYVGAESVGRLLGDAFGGLLLVALGSFAATSAVATGIAIVSWFLLWRYVHEKSVTAEGQTNERSATA